MNKTIEYYTNNSESYIESTKNVDMSLSYELFEKYIKPGCTILDLGCGSGRDSIYFQDKGYSVVAVDPVPAFVNNVKSKGILGVVCNALDMPFNNMFDGIWACASLLHVEEDKLSLAFDNCYRALKDNGIMYVSFKYGDNTLVDSNNRYFINLNEESIKKYIGKFKIKEIKVTKDMLASRNISWLNVVLGK